MPYQVIAPIIRGIVSQAARYTYRGLRLQDKIIDVTYRKSGLYNRGIVRGIKHGLIAGQVIGGTLQLGLNAPDTPGNEDGIQTPIRPRTPTRKPYKTRNRYSTRRRCWYPEQSRTNQRSRFSRYRKRF